MRRAVPLVLALLMGCAVAALRIDSDLARSDHGASWHPSRPLDLLELRAYDFRLQARGHEAPAPEVVLVAVDDASLTEVGRWPWSRARVADLLVRIDSGGPRVIGVDLVQSEPTASCQLDTLQGAVSESCRAEVADALSGPLGDDARLAAAVRASGRIVLGYFFDFSRRDESPFAGESVYQIVQRAPDAVDGHLPRGRYVTQNLPGLAAAAAGLAYFNFLPDADGLYRHAQLGVRFHDRIALPLSLAMLQRADPDRRPAIRLGPAGVDAVRLGGTVIPVDERGQLLINYRGPGRTIPHVSAAAVLGGRVRPETFRDKLVVLGITAIGVGDVRAAPLDRVYPGAEIHATVLDNILRGDFLHRPSWFGPDALTIVGLALLLGIGLQFTRGIASTLLAAVVLVGYVVASQWWLARTGMVLGIVYQALAVVLAYVGISVQHYVTVDREKRRTRRMLDLYLSPALATYVSDRPETLRLGGEKSDRTVLFSDVKGFTTISERLAPEQLVELLNVYLGEMTEVVFAHDGMLDKYIGDGVMAVWGAPVPQADHAARACRAALEMMERLERLNVTIAGRGWPELSIRIGLNSGPMVFGNMGSRGHLSLTVMGDNVNLGARLEGVNKQYGTAVLASEATIAAAGDTVVARELDVVRVKGKDETVRIYEILGPGDSAAHWAAVREHFAAGLAAYRARRFADAIAAFERALDERANDHPSALYIRRARAHLATPPPPDWEAVVTFDEK
jgi:adenylate cyclase